MKITIIIPVYNAEEFLEECLCSAVSQTIEEKEIICIDDGSSDKSGCILEQYQKKYPYIKVFTQKNEGSGAARNLGLKAASGKYVCFLDADDFYLDCHALEKMVYACENNGVQVCAGLRKIYENGILEEFYLYRDLFENGKRPEGVMLRYEECQNEYFYQNYIFSMKIIKENGILFPLYRRYQDAPFFLNVMTSINKYMILPIEFYGYRFSKKAVSRKGLYIGDTLKGICDNMKTARENHLEELKKLLIHRIDSEYAPWIIGSADEEILGILCKIQRIAFGEMHIKQDATDQEISLELMRSIVAGNIKGHYLGAFFQKMGISEVAVYGLGAFGSITVSELQKSSGITVYGVDKERKDVEGIVTGTMEEINKKCRDIIVTPLRDNKGLIRHIKGIWRGRVWGLPDLICKIEN